MYAAGHTTFNGAYVEPSATRCLCYVKRCLCSTLNGAYVEPSKVPLLLSVYPVVDRRQRRSADSQTGPRTESSHLPVADTRKRACAFDQPRSAGGPCRAGGFGACFGPERRGIVPRWGTIPGPKTPPNPLFFQNPKKHARACHSTLIQSPLAAAPKGLTPTSPNAQTPTAHLLVKEMYRYVYRTLCIPRYRHAKVTPGRVQNKIRDTCDTLPTRNPQTVPTLPDNNNKGQIICNVKNLCFLYRS